MIPIKDSPKTRRFPIVNISIVVLNIVVFIMQIRIPEAHLMEFINAYGIVPADIVLLLQGESNQPIQQLTSLFTGMFLHGGLFHLGGNMIYLWIFGDNIEDRIGHFKYLIFYILVGILATFIQIITAPSSTIPIIGASGAVAGVLGAYLVSCPKARVLALVPIFFFVTIAEFPAILFLLFWFILQLINGIAVLGGESVNVAFWAHIGGFVIGLIIINFFGKRIECE